MVVHIATIGDSILTLVIIIVFQALTKNSTDPATNPKFAANMITVNKANQIKNSYALKVKKIFNGNPYHEDFCARQRMP